MKDFCSEIDELNRLLDSAVAGRNSADTEPDPLVGWRQLVAVDAATPDPAPEFVASLRMLFADHPSAPTPIELTARGSGIVAMPLRLDRMHPGPIDLQSSRSRFVMAVAAIAGVLIAFFLFDPWMAGNERHGFGVPTARASSTAVVATATAAPDSLTTATGMITIYLFDPLGR